MHIRICILVYKFYILEYVSYIRVYIIYEYAYSTQSYESNVLYFLFCSILTSRIRTENSRVATC